MRTAWEASWRSYRDDVRTGWVRSRIRSRRKRDGNGRLRHIAISVDLDVVVGADGRIVSVRGKVNDREPLAGHMFPMAA